MLGQQYDTEAGLRCFTAPQLHPLAVWDTEGEQNTSLWGPQRIHLLRSGHIGFLTRCGPPAHVDQGLTYHSDGDAGPVIKIFNGNTLGGLPKVYCYLLQ